MKRNFLLCLLLLMSISLTAQQAAFSFISTANAPADQDGNELPLNNYGELSLDLTTMTRQMAAAPLEYSNARVELFIDLPTPEGEQQRFRIVESPVMHPELAARYPELKSYRAFGPYGSGRIAVSPSGVVAALMSEKGEYFISNATRDDAEHHLIYYTRDIDVELGNLDMPTLSCGWDAAEAEEDAILNGWDEETAPVATSRSSQALLGMHVYDIAVACTGEFAEVHGGTLVGVMDAYNQLMTTLNGLLEREVGVRFMLVSNNDDVIFLDPVEDPFNSANNGGALLSQVGLAMSNAGIELESIDLGHLLTGPCEDVGGVVSGSACSNSKTRGVTCNFSSNIVGVARGTMAHEIAHQFGVGHSWSNCPGSEGQLASGSAFEPGSGTTIMSYAGACDNQNIGGRDAYYHVGSLRQFIRFSREINAGCATILTPDNNEPEITLPYQNGFFIPISTPFELTGSATDADNDELIYIWEQYDLGPTSPLGEPFGNSPLFRSFPPDDDGYHRVFPRINLIANNISSLAEQLPDYSRDLTFRLTVRDQNENVGAAVWEEVAFRSTEEAGPFLVMSPNNGDENWQGGDYREISWDVANTNAAPVNCQSVDILLSADGGITYPIVLAAGAPNNGQTFVTIPTDVSGDEFRIKVAAADNVFFDISNADFSISAPTVPNFTLAATPLRSEVCLPEAAALNFDAGSVLDFDGEITLAVVSELPEGAVANFSSATLIPGEDSDLTIDFSEVSYSGELEVMVRATAEGVDTTFRTILLDITENTFEDLVLESPEEGTTGVLFTANYDWTEAVNADFYDVQIATSPDFAEANIFEQSSNQVETAYAQDEFLTSNTLYFWRVRPVNDCGPGPWADPQSFRTVNSQCDTYGNSDNVLIPGTGASQTRESIIFVDQMGTINDVNLPNVSVNYQVVRYVKVTLVSPVGTEVVLYDENCFFTNNINIGFDDDAPMDIVCPPDDNRVFRPVGNLSDFQGEETFGSWILRVDVSETGGSAGAIDSWGIEFCANVDAEAPNLLVNDDSEVPPGAGTNITGQVLRVEDSNFGPSEVEYTLVRGPVSGFLRLGNDLIEEGATFTQEQISAAQLFYQNTLVEAERDDWSFVVQNPDGGYIPVNYHVINIFEGAISDVDDAIVPAQLELFPNPVTDQLQIRWSEALGEDLPLELIDIAGRSLLRQNISGVLRNHTLDMQGLPAGVYFLRMGSMTQRVVKR